MTKLEAGQQASITTETAEMVGTLAAGVLTATGHAELAALVPVAEGVIKRFANEGIEVPSLDEFRDKLDSFKDSPDLETQ